MAPMKQPRDSTTRNRDETSRRRYRGTDASMLYRCVGDLCGEECEQDLLPANETPALNRISQKREQKPRRDNNQDIEMDAAASDGDDCDWNEDREKRTSGPKAGRVNKLKAKKVPSKQVKELPLKIGVQKAKRYLFEALDFGLNSGYLTMKDKKGRNLRVSSEILLSNSVTTDRRQRKAARQQQLRDSQDSAMMEVRDNEGDVEESRRHKRSKKHRSHSRSRRGGKKRSGRSRSRSRSKRRHGRRHTQGRSRSLNAEQERAKNAKAEGAEEQDDMGENSQETNASSRNEDDNDDSKSTKSVKSSKSSPNNDSQTTNEEKKSHADDDGSNDDEPSDDDLDEKK